MARKHVLLERDRDIARRTKERSGRATEDSISGALGRWGRKGALRRNLRESKA